MSEVSPDFKGPPAIVRKSATEVQADSIVGAVRDYIARCLKQLNVPHLERRISVGAEHLARLETKAQRLEARIEKLERER